MSINRLARTMLPTAVIFFGCTFAPTLTRAQEAGAPSAQQAPAKKLDKKEIEKREKELATPYKKWLNEEVPYIISSEERSAFLKLQTNEEREEFIESFWDRRNPDPDSPENEFKEEHYRRIAYANEQFASGVPGWRTDRGRIYIIWGKPDELEAHPTGGVYNRPMSEGGGSTQTYPYEVWRYREMEGVGQNIEIEFVDTTLTGEYHMTMDPGEKDALAKMPGAGLSLVEAMGLSNEQERFNRTDGSTAPRSMLNAGNGSSGDPTNVLAKDDEFNRLEQFSKVQAAPPVKFKDLEEVVSSRILRDQIHFDYRTDFMRITSDSILVPITVQIQNRQMTFRNHEGVQSATLDLFSRITTLSGRVVQTFEDTIQQDFPDSLLERSLGLYSIYQKAVPLRPGLYKLDIVIKDVNSGNIGVLDNALRVSEIPDDTLDASSLILADQMEPVAARDLGVGQFVIGSTKVRPSLHGEFKADQPLGIYLQIYNLKVDDTTHKNNLSLDVKVTQGQQTVEHEVASGDDLKQLGEEVTFQRVLAAKTLPPGKYQIVIQATDGLTKKTVSRTADFTIASQAASTAAAADTTAR